MSYVDVPFLNAEQIERFTGSTPQALGLVVLERIAEDGVSKIRGSYVRQDDFPPELTILDWMGFRKVRFYSQASSVHSKRVLMAESQIQPEQGSNLLTMLEQRRVDAREREDISLDRLKSLAELKAKAEKMEDKRRAKDALVAERLALAEGDDEDEPCTTLVVIDAEKKARLEQFSVAAAEACVQPSAPAPVPKRRRKKQQDGNTGPAFDGSDVVSGADPKASSVKAPSNSSLQLEHADDSVIDQVMKHDPPMRKVCRYLGSVPECLKDLSIEKCMAGTKLKIQTNAVGALTLAVSVTLHVLAMACSAVLLRVMRDGLGPAQAKRLLPSLMDNNIASTLTRRIALFEAVQELVQSKDLRKIEADERAKYYQLLASNDVTPSDSLKMKIVVVAAEEQAAHVLGSPHPTHMIALLNMLLPFSSEETEGFDYFHPSVNSIVLEALASNMDPDPNSWAITVKTEAPPEGGEDPAAFNWQAG